MTHNLTTENGTPSLNDGHFTANVCCGTFSHCCKTFPVCCEFFQLATKLKSAILESMDAKASKISMVLVRVAHGPVWSLDFTNSCWSDWSQSRPSLTRQNLSLSYVHHVDEIRSRNWKVEENA